MRVTLDAGGKLFCSCVEVQRFFSGLTSEGNLASQRRFCSHSEDSSQAAIAAMKNQVDRQREGREAKAETGLAVREKGSGLMDGKGQ